MNILNSNSCRICCAPNAYVQLFDRGFSIASLLESVINIKIQPIKYASNVICVNCLEDINTSVKLKTDVEHSEARWNKLTVKKVSNLKDEQKKNIEHILKSKECDGERLNDSIENKDYRLDKSINEKLQNELNNELILNDYQTGELRNNRLKEIEHKTTQQLLLVQCDVCFKQFVSKYSLAAHQRLHENVNSYFCPICSTQFKCPTCSQTCLDNSTLRNNLAAHSDSKKHKCIPCSKLFLHSSEFIDHIRTVHDIDKRHRCGKCDEIFSKSSDLRVHFRKHMENESFECKYVL